MSQLHDFTKQLQFSELASDEPFWADVYRKAFPGIVNQMPCSGDHESQRQGIDRLVLLNNGRIIRIDEKKRTRVYPDILLEYVSVDTTNAPGWINKNLVIDYIAYAFMPTKKVYVLDWLTLRRAWTLNGEMWKRVYGTRSAENKGYKTLSCPVPIPVLLKAMNNAMVVDLNVIALGKAA